MTGMAHGPHAVPTPIMGESPAMLAVMKSAARVADSNVTVLIQGETGTGKALLARFLHERGRRRQGPFMTVNCAGAPEHVLEVELFGHAKGSFAREADQAGKLARASGGTLFLEEIGDLPLPLQARVLQALEQRQVEHISGERPIPVDLRLVAATSRPLDDDVAAGRFREDLYYRVAVVVLALPPLRERGDDIRLLAERCVTKAAVDHHRPVVAISHETLAVLRTHPWPGNVRQLFDVMQRALLLGEGPVLLPGHLPAEIRFPDSNLSPVRSPTDRGAARGARAGETLLPLAELERRHIQRALSMTGGHIAHAAESLGIHRNTLRRKLQEYGIDWGHPVEPLQADEAYDAKTPGADRPGDLA